MSAWVAYPFDLFEPMPETIIHNSDGSTVGAFPRSTTPDWCERIIAYGPDPNGAYHYDGDRSKAVWAITCALVRCGWNEDEICEELLRRTNAISEHLYDQSNPEGYARRQAERAKLSVGNDFRRETKNGRPRVLIDQPNIRLALAKLAVELKYNEFSLRVRISGPEGKNERDLDDIALDEVRLIMAERWEMKIEKTEFFSILRNEAVKSSYHPILEYLSSLHWDGQHRLDNWLTTYMGVEETPYTRAVGAIVLIAAVRRVREPGCKFDEILVLESPKQGLDKSTALKVLAVKDHWFTDSVPMGADDRMMIERLQGHWIVEMPELKGMSDRQVEHLKAFLSRSTDRARLAYAHLPTDAPRQSIMIGTTNEETYLKDMTGNRRFWPVRVTRVDTRAIMSDRDQLWAEASMREADKNPKDIRLDPALYASAEVEQDARALTDPWVDVVASALEPYESGKILCDDAWIIFNIPEGMRTQKDRARLGESFRLLGWTHVQLRLKGKPRWHYAKGTDIERLTRIVIQRDIQTQRLSLYRVRDGDPHPQGEAF